MPGLTADLELDISQAQSAADDFASSLESTLSNVADSFGTNLAGALDSGSGSIGDLATSADTATSSLDTASESGKKFSDQTLLLSGFSEAASGQVAGLGDKIATSVPIFGEAALGAVALGAGVAELAKAGLEATSAEQRWNLILGDSAGAVRSVNVGSLNTDLFALTKSLGSTSSATQNAAATIFQFAENAGASKAKAADFTDQLFALAGRAVALNPAIGDVSDVASRMESQLGRATVASRLFGISISQSEINLRAETDTGKTTASSLTAYEKSAAAAEIASSRYGDTLGKTVADGAKNAEIQQRSLKASISDMLGEIGKPLVAPVFDIIKAGTPIIGEFGQQLGNIAGVALPALASTLSFIAPAMGPVLTSFLAYEGVVKLLVPLLNLTTGTLINVSESALLAGTSMGVAAGEASSMSAALAGAIGPLAAVFLGAFAVGKILSSALGETPDAGAAALKRLEGALTSTGTWIGNTSIGVFNAAVAFRSFHDSTSLATARLDEFNTIASKSPEQAQKLIDKMVEQGKDASDLQHAMDKLNQAQAQGALDQAKHAQAVDQANIRIGAQAKLVESAGTSLAAYSVGVGSAGQALKDLKAAQQNANDQVDLFKNKLESLLNPQIEFVDANQKFGESIKKVADAYKEETSKTKDATDVQNDQKDAVIGAVKALETNAEATFAVEVANGRAATAQDVATKALQDGTSALEDQLIKSGLSKQAADDFLTSLGLFPGKSAEAASGLIGGLGKTLTEELVPAMVSAGAEIGDAIGKGLKNSLVNSQDHFLTPSEAAAIVNKYKQPIKDAAGIESPSKVFAAEIGLPMVQGIAQGMTQNAGLVSSAARAVLQFAPVFPATKSPALGVAGAAGAAIGGSSSSTTTTRGDTNLTVVAQTNADPAAIASEMGWLVKTSGY